MPDAVQREAGSELPGPAGPSPVEGVNVVWMEVGKTYRADDYPPGTAFMIRKDGYVADLTGFLREER